MKIISGGQIGADIAALRAAKRLGLETGGWMPKGFRTKDGDHPEYAQEYGMMETQTYDYPRRTKLNVIEADCTLRLLRTLQLVESFVQPKLFENITNHF